MSDNPARAQNADNQKNDARLAYVDDLTGLYNRRYLKSTLPLELARAKEQKSALSLFMIDFDNFKAINDTYGHLNGDKALVEISDILKKEIGRDGIFIRYAGDEFTVLLSGKPLKEAVSIGNRLLHAASRHELELKSGKKVSNFSFSIGVAVYPDDADTAENLIDKADQALYSAKRMGKNRLAAVKDIINEVLDRDLLLNALPCKKFIDREKEVEYLRKAAQNGAKRYILIKGGDGVGKTRLMREVFRPGNTEPSLLFVKCRKEDVYQQYGAISAALNDYPDSKEALNVNDTFNAITNLIRKSAPKKIIILVDDILWIDGGSLKVVQWILENKEYGRVLVAATVSKDALKADRIPDAPFLQFTPAGEMPQPELLNLEPFSETVTAELLKAVFPGLNIQAALNKKIYQTSGGYPSVIEQIIKYMLNKRMVYPKGGKWMLDEKSISDLPSSLGELLDKFISELDDDTREVLSKAAVLGNDFNTDILKLLYGKNEGQLIDTLDKLREEGVLEQDAFTDSNILSFMNTAVRDSMYGAIRKSELQRMHKRAAELIRDYYKSETGKVYGELRYHLQEAGEEEVMEAETKPSREEIAEKPLSENSARIAPNVIILLRAAWLNSRLYPLDNKTCIDSIEGLHNDIKAILDNDPTLTITISGENALINGAAVSRKKLSVALSRALGSLFSEYGISSMTFKQGLAKKELESFFSIVLREDDTEKAGTFAKVLKDKNITNIKIDEVKYRKASEFKSGRGMKNSALARLILENPTLSNLFSVGGNGMEVSPTEIWKEDKKHLADLLLSMDPSLRTKIIGGSAAYEGEGSNFICDILSEFGEGNLSKILKDGCQDAKLSPSELDDFIKVILKSQNQKNIPLSDIQNIFKKAGVDKKAIARVMRDTPPEPFFEDMAKKFIEGGKADALGGKVINNLVPLTEALIIKGDMRTIEELIKSLLVKLDSESPSVRASAAEGMGKVLNVLLEKEIFDVAARIVTELSRRLKTEENIRVYAEMLKDFEDVMSTLIQKQKPLLLISPLAILKEEAGPTSLRSNEFKRYIKASINRAMTSENMNILLLCLRSKAEKDYGTIMELLSQFEEEVIPSLMGVLARKDDMKWDPFDIYMKKQNMVTAIRKMSEGAVIKLGGLLNDKRAYVAENAIEIFSYINDMKYLPYLEPATLHQDKEVRKAALEAIRKLNGGDDVVKFLIKVLTKEKDQGLTSRIIDIISELVSPAFAPYVKNELKGKIRLDDYDKLAAKLAGKK